MNRKKKKNIIIVSVIIGIFAMTVCFISNGLQYQLYSYACGKEGTHYVWHWRDQQEIEKFIEQLETEMTVTENSEIGKVKAGGRILEIHAKENGQQVTYWMHGNGEIRKIIYDAEGNEKREYYETDYPVDNLYSIWYRIDGVETEE